MELTLTVHVPRRRTLPVDVVVRWSGHQTAASLGRALADHFAVPVRALSAGGRRVDPACAVGRTPLVHGAAVTVDDGDARVGAGADGAAASPSVLELAVVGGPDAGRSRLLVPPGVRVGRRVPDGLSIADESLSRTHARLRVDPSGVVVTDEGSTNGVFVDGIRVREQCPVDSGSTLVLGGSTLRVRRRAGAGLAVEEDGGGRLLVRPGPIASDAVDDLVVGAPTRPPDRYRPRVPWVAALLPVPVALVLAWFLGPHLLAFAVLGPVLLLGTALSDRWGSGRAHRRALADHERALAEARGVAERLLAEDVARLDRAHPDPHAVLRTAEQRLPGLWGRRDLRVRLGLGEVATRVVWSDESARTRPRASHGPVVIDLDEAGGVTVVGPPDRTDSLLAGVIGQLCVRCPPSVLQVAVTSTDPGWRWVVRLPHAVGVPGGASTAGDGVDPAGSRPKGPGGPGPGGRARVLVVPAPDAAGADVVTAARDEGWVVLRGVPDGRGHGAAPGSMPATGAALVELGADPRVRTSSGDTSLVPDHVGAWWTDRVSRALAPLVEVATGGAAGLPSAVALVNLLGEEPLTAQRVADRWADGRGRPTAPVGVGQGGLHTIDLVADGPHVLVGGTTGAGKSEFLRTLVAGLAVSCSPQDLALVLVDFKGGAAFGACADLPHVAGIVTDLDAHLVERALTSLGAELRRRERLFATVGAADLDAYRRALDVPEPVPRLVVVVDELKALVAEVPRFVDGLVRLAAQGRSLGVHLVLATQRPSGALSSEIQANVNLRVAFRMRDRADSVDVLDDPAAAHLDPATPGRGISRGGDGRLQTFQTALVARPPARSAPHLVVHEMPWNGATPGPFPLTAPAAPPVAGADEALGDLVAVVSRAAVACGHRRARRPWPAPLPAVTPPEGPGCDGAGTIVGLVDEPDLQRITSWSWTPQSGTWLVSGAPRSGRSTAARAVVLSAASRLGPGDLHVHVVDPTAALADLTALPHVGTTVHGGDDRGLHALVDHLRALVGARRDRHRDPARGATPTRPADPLTLLVVDGWEQLVDQRSQPWADPVADAIVAVLRDGPAVGVLGVVTGGRALLHPRWSGVGDQVLVLGAVDPLDAALAGLRPVDLPSAPPPGRGVRLADRRQLQVAATTPETTQAVRRTCPASLGTGPASRPWRHTPLPTAASRGPRTRHEGLELGLCRTADGPRPWAWRPVTHGRRLLVAGPARSGRSTALVAVAEAARLVGRPVVLVSRSTGVPRRLRADPSFWLLPPDDPGVLVEVRREHRDLVVLVDDADRLDDAPVLPALREMAELVDRDAGLLAVATTTATLTTRFRGLDVETARHRFGILLSPRATDGELLGHGRLVDVQRVPGRGLVIGDGAALELQVYRADPSGIGLGGEGVDALGRQGDERRAEREGEQEPAEEPGAALDHAAGHREEQRTPHDRRGLGPRGVAEPRPRDDAEADAEERDEQGRHDDPDGVAALTQGELVDVERGDTEQGHRLDAGQEGGDASGAA